MIQDLNKIGSGALFFFSFVQAIDVATLIELSDEATVDKVIGLGALGFRISSANKSKAICSPGIDGYCLRVNLLSGMAPS